jgi:hypothetical protein
LKNLKFLTAPALHGSRSGLGDTLPLELGLATLGVGFCRGRSDLVDRLDPVDWPSTSAEKIDDRTRAAKTRSVSSVDLDGFRDVLGSLREFLGQWLCAFDAYRA